MNKILVVGHPESGYEDVEALLNACGMAQAMPSRREGFLPHQISETLCKAHNATPLQELGTSNGISQLQAGPVWHGMAMDLMLGNLDQPLWGWADPQSIYLLDYWRELDPSIHFILVYDGPHSALTREVDWHASHLDLESVERLTRGWSAYNAALLHFFHRNPSRCLLVHSRQVRASANRYLQQVQARIDAPWRDVFKRLDAPDRDTDEIQAARALDRVAFELPGLTSGANPALPLFLADALARHQTTSLRLYEELQASANLPFAADGALIQSPAAALEAWRAMEELQQQVREQQLRLYGQAEQFDLERAAHRVAIVQVEQAYAELEHDSDVLLAQLYQVEEELHRLHRTSRERDDELGVLKQHKERLEQQCLKMDALAQQRHTEVSEARARLAELDRELAERGKILEALTSQVQEERLFREANAKQFDAERARSCEVLAQAERASAQAVQAATREREGVLAQLHQAQEDLEAVYRKSEERSNQVIALQRQKQQLEQRCQQAEEASRRQQQELSAAQKRIAALEEDAANRARNLQTEQKKSAELAQQRYAQQQETKRLQAELASVQQKAVEIKRGDSTLEKNNLLLTELHQAQEDLERHYLELRALRSKQLATPSAELSAKLQPAIALYGAADRVREQLEYQVGSVLIKRSRTMAGWVGLPWAVMSTIRQHRREQAGARSQEAPPLDSYRDADEAERVKNHLSYRVGCVFLARVRSPLGWLGMPVALRREVIAFRASRRSS